MKYMVTWTENAENDLADIWLHAADRQEVADASHRIDLALQHNPDSLGQPIGNHRVYTDSPLAVTFTVSPPDCRVWVLRAYRI